MYRSSRQRCRLCVVLGDWEPDGSSSVPLLRNAPGMPERGLAWVFSLGELKSDRCCCYLVCVFNNSHTKIDCASVAQGKLSWNRHPVGINQKKLFGNLGNWSCFLWAVSWFPRTKCLSFLNIQLPLGHKELWWIGALYSFLLLLNSYLQTEVI